MRAVPQKAVNAFADASRSFYLSLHQPRFTRGWLNRVAFVQKTALDMIQKGVA